MDFRRILGHHPTGVAIIAALDDGEPIGLIVGTFTSISLDPPLVGFFIDEKSRTWPRMEAIGRFCVNLLGVHDVHVAKAFADRGDNRFDGQPWDLRYEGGPRLATASGWIDCRIVDTHAVGDHVLVVGHVDEMHLGTPQDPLVFHRGDFIGIERNDL